MSEAINTTDLGLIRDAANPLVRQVRKAKNLVADMFWQNGQAETTKEAKMGEQMKTT